MSDQPPAAEEAAAAGARPGGAWGSLLSCQELAAVGSVGFTPVGQVFGAAVYAALTSRGSRCPAVTQALDSETQGPPAAQVPGRSDPPGFGPLVEAMHQARRAAVDRMTAECAALGGHGVVGVRLTRAPFALGGLEFTAAGTAVRATSTLAGPPVPFTAGVCGQDFARLVRSGWVPAGLVLGIAIGARHDDQATTRQARPWSGNAEMGGWTVLMNHARQHARSRLEDDVRRLGAEGVVIADMRLRAGVRDCPAAVGRHDHIVEATLVGTAIVAFAHASRSHDRALTVMPLGRWPRQAG